MWGEEGTRDNKRMEEKRKEEQEKKEKQREDHEKRKEKVRELQEVRRKIILIFINFFFILRIIHHFLNLLIFFEFQYLEISLSSIKLFLFFFL